ncbi:MAG: isochorismatase family protein, partial [Treponema sp.]|nr:isochorismatase family protein [Treponema sp.]
CLKIKNVVISGTQYPNCIRGTATDAMSYDYDVIVVTDCCSAKTPEIANANIIDMKNMGIKCITLEELQNS